jgi:predicted PurR-regulated permease PerM
LILGYVLYFPARFLARRTRLGYGLSVGLVFAVYLVVAVLLVISFAAPIVKSGLELLSDLSAALKSVGQFLLEYLPGSRGGLEDAVLGPLSGLMQAQFQAQEFQAAVDSLTSSVIKAVVQGAAAIGGLVMKLLTVHLMALFALLELPRLYLGGMRKLSPTRRREWTILAGQMERKWTRYFWATVGLAALLGAINFLQLTLLGVPGAPVVGLITATLALIPVIGPFINIFVIAIVVLVQGSTTIALDPLLLALIAVAINLVVVAILAEIVFPKVMGEVVSLPTIVIIPAVIIAAALAGALGTIIVVPLVGFGADLVGYTMSKIRGGDPYPGQEEPVFFEGLRGLSE